MEQRYTMLLKIKNHLQTVFVKSEIIALIYKCHFK